MEIRDENSKQVWNKNPISVFLFAVVIFKIISVILFYVKMPYSPMLEVYNFFSIQKLLQHISMYAIPASWPNVNIHSYAYDFSVIYAITSHLDIINDKSVVMSDNILPYGPLAFLFFHLLSLIKIKTALSLYRGISVALFCTVIFMASKRISMQIWLRMIIFAVIALVCTPFFIFIISGNIEIFIFFLCFLSLLIKKDKPMLAGIIIAICAAIKYYPVIFLLEFLKDRHYKIFIISICVAVFLFFAPFTLLHGGFLPNLMFTFGQIMQSSKLCYENAATYCSSGGLSIAEYFYNLGINLQVENLLYKATVFIILATGIWCYVKIKSRLLAMMALITTICLIPQVSVFYKLSYLMIPILLNDKKGSMIAFIIAILVALCLSPIPFYFALNFSGMRADFSFLIFLIHAFLVIYLVRSRQEEKAEKKYS